MKNKKHTIMFILTIGFIIFTLSFFSYAFYQKNVIANKYEQAKTYIEEGNFDSAIKILNTLQNYKNSDVLKHEAEQGIIYSNALNLLNEKNYIEAINNFIQIETYKDSKKKLTEAKYYLAVAYYDEKNYNSAKKIFVELDDYLDSQLYLAQIDLKNIQNSQKVIYEKAYSHFQSKEYETALELFKTIADYTDVQNLIKECQLQIVRKNPNNILAAGIRCSAAITNKRTVLTAGSNAEGQRNVSHWENIISIDTYGCFTIGLNNIGKVMLAGIYDGKKVDVTTWNEIIDIAAGERFIVGLKNDGTVVADGHNGDGQIDVTDWKNIIAIDAGWNFTVGLTADQKLCFTGVAKKQEEQFHQNKEKWQNVVNIAAGGGGRSFKAKGMGHTVGLKSDGTVVAVGDNSYGQCDVAHWKNIIKIAAGDWYTVGLQEDGQIVITGTNTPDNTYINEEIIKQCTNVVDIAAGFGQTLCLNADGTITSFGFNDNEKRSATSEWKNLMLP